MRVQAVERLDEYPATASYPWLVKTLVQFEHDPKVAGV
jgi:hypothetical protein